MQLEEIMKDNFFLFIIWSYKFAISYENLDYYLKNVEEKHPISSINNNFMRL